MRIHIERLQRSFAGRRVLNIERFESPETGIVLLRGQNGCGKTTLLKILAGHLLPDGGRFWVDSNAAPAKPLSPEEWIGYVPASSASMYSRLTGKENLVLFGTIRGISLQAIHEKINLATQSYLRPEALATPYLYASSGMRQGLAITRALLPDPQILLLDEPTNSLDRETICKLQAFLRSYAEKNLVFWVSHRDEESGWADQVLELREGNLARA